MLQSGRHSTTIFEDLDIYWEEIPAEYLLQSQFAHPKDLRNIGIWILYSAFHCVPLCSTGGLCQGHGANLRYRCGTLGFEAGRQAGNVFSPVAFFLWLCPGDLGFEKPTFPWSWTVSITSEGFFVGLYVFLNAFHRWTGKSSNDVDERHGIAHLPLSFRSYR